MVLCRILKIYLPKLRSCIKNSLGVKYEGYYWYVQTTWLFHRPKPILKTWFMENANYSKLTSMHFYAWKSGLKTGMYYLRTKRQQMLLNLLWINSKNRKVPVAEAPLETSIVAKEVTKTIKVEATSANQQQVEVKTDDSGRRWRNDSSS